ncbi:hypothetical protein ACFX1X_040003 [Malus domestica]
MRVVSGIYSSYYHEHQNLKLNEAFGIWTTSTSIQETTPPSSQKPTKTRNKRSSGAGSNRSLPFPPGQ